MDLDDLRHKKQKHTWCIRWQSFTIIVVATMSPTIENPVVFFDITLGGSPKGRIEMELRADIVPRTAEVTSLFAVVATVNDNHMYTTSLPNTLIYTYNRTFGVCVQVKKGLVGLVNHCITKVHRFTGSFLDLCAKVYVFIRIIPVLFHDKLQLGRRKNDHFAS